MSKEHEKSTFSKDVETTFQEITEKHIINHPDRAIIMLAVDMSDEANGGTTVAMSGDETALAYALAKILTAPAAKQIVEIAKCYAELQARHDDDATFNAAFAN